MPRIVNAFRGTDPTASVISKLGMSLFGDRLGNELDREKLREAQRGNFETEALMGRTAERGAAGLAADPVAQAMMIGSGYDPVDFGKMGLLETATTQGPRAEATQGFQVGTGQAYSNTAGAYDANQARMRDAADAALAENARQFNQTPVEALVAGKPAFVPRSGAFDPEVAAILSDAEAKGTQAMANFGKFGELPQAEQTYLGADPSAAKPGATWNYITQDGKSFLTNDAAAAQGVDLNGQPLPPGGYKGTVTGPAGDVGLTNSTTSGAQQALIAGKKFNFLLDQADALAASPDAEKIFGPQGYVRGVGQELMQGAQGVAQLFAGDPAKGQAVTQEIGEAQGTLKQLGLANALPELYDPRLPATQTLWALMLYSGAATLAGQSNRSVSDKDIQLMRGIIGDPQSLFTSPQNVRAKLALLRNITGGLSAVDESALTGGVTAPGAAPAAPAAPPAQSGPVDWRSYFGGP